MLVNYDKKLKKSEYKLARILEVHPDAHGVVRTVTVGVRRSDLREKSLPYVAKPLEKMKIGIQRLAVLCPVEDQNSGCDVTSGLMGDDGINAATVLGNGAATV